ncbi:hypothetical protein KC19_7G093800 [Ceratodon purpureus]|uniref:Uncharacterized protein n=2 Tax=Ceratodon purpureus TaxID=3225 RepID=A0A8T0H4L1_CERPU|nr:hypothetical protein KC19_7G093800 [Ceratodon purpureus]
MERYGFGSCGEVEASSRLGSSEFTTFRETGQLIVERTVVCVTLEGAASALMSTSTIS